MRCTACAGSGKMMGGGFVRVDCPHCKNGIPNEKKEDEKVVVKIDRRSIHYKKAISDIMNLNPGWNKAEAEKAYAEAEKEL
jgi:phage FluMu protein Com